MSALNHANEYANYFWSCHNEALRHPADYEKYTLGRNSGKPKANGSRKTLYDVYYKAFQDIDPESGLLNLLSTLAFPSRPEIAWKDIMYVTEKMIDYYADHGNYSDNSSNVKNIEENLQQELLEEEDYDEERILLEEMLAKEEEDIKKLNEDNQKLQLRQTNICQNSDDQKEVKRKSRACCLLQMWIEEPDKKKEILENPELIAADIFSFVFAAFTNSYAVLAWTIWELLTEKERHREDTTINIPSINEMFQNELKSFTDNMPNHQKEEGLKAVYRRDNSFGIKKESEKENEAYYGKDDQITANRYNLEQYENLTSIRILILEILRMKTPGILFRKVVDPNGFKFHKKAKPVPKNHYVAFSADYILHHPKFYKNPRTFDPSRFLEPRDEKKRAGLYYIGFGSGRHPCLGSRFAMLEINVVLTQLLKENTFFEIKPVTKRNEIKLGTSQMSLVSRPTHRVEILFQSK